MNRKILIQGLMRMIIPMMLGMILAMGVGTLVGVLLGLEWKHTLFFIVTPVLAGGIGEGILHSTDTARSQGRPGGALVVSVNSGNDYR